MYLACVVTAEDVSGFGRGSGDGTDACAADTLSGGNQVTMSSGRVLTAKSALAPA